MPLQMPARPRLHQVLKDRYTLFLPTGDYFGVLRFLPLFTLALSFEPALFFIEWYWQACYG
jgi:hypothetical protein